MTNILFIHQSAELYGSDKMLLSLLLNLNKDKFFVVVILPNDGPLKDILEAENIKVIVGPVLKIYRDIFRLKNFMSFIKDIKKSLRTVDDLHKKYKFDLVYSNTLAVILGALFSKKAGIKHLWHVHEIITHPTLLANIFPKILYNFSEIIVCNSKATKENLVLRYKKIETKITLVYNGVSVPKFQSKESSKIFLGFDEHDIVITLIGRISRLKGHKWLMNTYIKHLHNEKNVKLLFVGSPVERQEHYLFEIEKSISESKLGNNIKIVSFTNDLEKIWNATDIVVMPSTEAESFGLVAVESMLENKPVIGSKLGGLKEIIKHDETGYLVEINNEIELSTAIKKLINSKELREFFGNNGYKRALKHFSLENYVKKIESLLVINKK
ncbi:glycosyltransferase family 4 protein [Flavobacterium sp.]|uniref:glycosyltransferase family 4 protein n=1 Tax=Flavobacterium sp. TaxID=239 RepID=UPI0040487226